MDSDSKPYRKHLALLVIEGIPVDDRSSTLVSVTLCETVDALTLQPKVTHAEGDLESIALLTGKIDDQYLEPEQQYEPILIPTDRGTVLEVYQIQHRPNVFLDQAL